MRIIAGKYKGMKINAVEGLTARPTSDFIREMIFSTLYSLNQNYDKVLDLYSGSGAMGLEAISRGCREVVFVDGSKKSVSTIISNITKLKCHDNCKVLLKKVENFLSNSINHQKGEIDTSYMEDNQKSIEPEGCRYNLIFADPPYNKGLVNNTVRQILDNDLLIADGILIVEHSKEEPIKDDLKKFVFKEKNTANIFVSFIQNI
ncbi:MAG: 16S rRNA (guanine(966)-N(2))-methyltransferase RsmD [Candidatus Cloacimonetes bacterium]|nr:16S rRNA (guanine(966)-N(2))-methyltransferase RsmD [Candidatus Cloacimonadota bacterium]